MNKIICAHLSRAWSFCLAGSLNGLREQVRKLRKRNWHRLLLNLRACLCKSLGPPENKETRL